MCMEPRIVLWLSNKLLLINQFQQGWQPTTQLLNTTRKEYLTIQHVVRRLIMLY